jgi:hypothetical protein
LANPTPDQDLFFNLQHGEKAEVPAGPPMPLPAGDRNGFKETGIPQNAIQANIDSALHLGKDRI